MSEAVRWYRKAAEQGNAEAMNNLGSAYCAGSGVPQSLSECARLFRKSAELGNDTAMFNLGLMFENGRESRRTTARR